MAEARFRKRIADLEYGVSCPECASPKSRQAARCAYCYHESTRKHEVYTCPKCGGLKSGQARQCRFCRDLARVGRVAA